MKDEEQNEKSTSVDDHEEATAAASVRAPEIWRKPITAEGTNKEWDKYWDRLNDEQPIFGLEGMDYAERFSRAFGDTSSARVLDFGCGFGHLCEAMSGRVSKIAVWDSSPNMRSIAFERLARLENVLFLDLSDDRNPPRQNYDFVLINSVVQYMDLEEFHLWLKRWSRMLTEDGRIVVSDIMTDSYSFIRDLIAFLLLCRQHGVLLESIRSGINEIGNYSATKVSRPLLRMDAKVLSAAADTAGLQVEMLKNNLTYHSGRLTAVFRRDP